MALLDFQPVLGRVFKIQKNLCAFFCQTTSGEACVHDKRTKREKERPERAASSQPRATPWVSAYKHLRPVRAKVWFTFALTGRREWGHGTQGVALGSGLVGLSARAGPQTRLFPHYLHLLNFSILNTLRCRRFFSSHNFRPSGLLQMSVLGADKHYISTISPAISKKYREAL